MSHDPIKIFTHAIGHQAAHERAKGNTSVANGLGLVATGFVLLPIPFIGIPLLIWGIIKLCQGSGDAEKVEQNDH